MIALVRDDCHESCLSLCDVHILQVKLAKYIYDCTIAFS